jgi:bilirubin oxidase
VTFGPFAFGRLSNTLPDGSVPLDHSGTPGIETHATSSTRTTRSASGEADMFTRRQVLRFGAVGGAGLLVPSAFSSRAMAAIPGGTLNPTTIAKYAAPLVIPPAMPRTAQLANDTIDYYALGVRQFRQQILPPGSPTTTVWGYGSAIDSSTYNYPAFTVEAQAGRPVWVTWINQLVDGSGNYLPHLLPVDQTLHWANPPGGTTGRDTRPSFSTTPGRYTGPVPMVVHLHGGHTNEESDGYPEAWYLPVAGNIPASYAQVGSKYEMFEQTFAARTGQAWGQGLATFEYLNDHRASTMWFHDHTLGMTRLNVYAGPAGFYVVRGGAGDVPDGVLPGPAPRRGDPAGIAYHEIPIAIQDRAFNADGSLFYPDSRRFFDGFAGPYVPGSDVAPIWNPEFFGNTMVVNGRTWPALAVEPRRYRLRLLNGCNSRFLILKIAASATAPRPATPALPWWQIGSEGGLLPAPVRLNQLLIAPAERADVVVDFTGLPVGTALYLINEAPDGPFAGGTPGVDYVPADPATTGQVMKFVVRSLLAADTSVPPATFVAPSLTPLGAATNTRKVSLGEMMSMVPGAGPAAAVLGTVDAAGGPVMKMWDDPITENPALGSTEIWEIHNFTVDAHPVHIHEVQFQVVDRQPFGGTAQVPQPWEVGFKDTVVAYPNQITRVKATFDLPGLFPWHCHILEHEDNEMMRPYRVG